MKTLLVKFEKSLIQFVLMEKNWLLELFKIFKYNYFLYLVTAKFYFWIYGSAAKQK